MTLGTVILEIQNTTLRGYIMEDGTFQFLVKGKMRTFDSLLAVWAMWTDN